MITDTKLFKLIAAEAKIYHGALSTAKIKRLGASSTQIARWHGAGMLHPWFRRCWAIGHSRLSDRGTWSAAVQASGNGAALAGLTAAALWGITRRSRVGIHVAVPRYRRPIRGVRLQEMAHLENRTVVEDGIRVLTPLWTIATLAADLSHGELVNVIDKACFRRLINLVELIDLGNDGSRRLGAASLRHAVRAYLEGDHGTDSGFEDRAFPWVDALTDDETLRQNVVVEAAGTNYRLDVAVERLRINIEFDGPQHDLPAQRRRDRKRDADLTSEGWIVCRVRQADFEHDPVAAFAPVRAAVAARLG